MSDSEPLLSVRELTHNYPASAGFAFARARLVTAVDKVSFDLPAGATLGIVGESGCGKSTVARCITRLVEPSAGEVRFEGRDLLQLDARSLRVVRRSLQMVFQDPYGSLNPRKNIRTILTDGFAIHNLLSTAERRERAAELLDLVGLSREALERYPHEFSGGQRQRIVIARALALRPKLIVADEPVSALDISIQAQILNLLLDLQDRYALTYVLISHDLRVIDYASTFTAVMYLGRIVEIGRREDVFRRPRHPYTKALLSSVLQLDDRAGVPATLEGEIPSPMNPPAGCRFHTRCPRSRPICRETSPELDTFEIGHRAACFFPLD
jgi:peptide/nickel transport system ATP-binding protein